MRSAKNRIRPVQVYLSVLCLSSPDMSVSAIIGVGKPVDRAECVWAQRWTNSAWRIQACTCIRRCVDPLSMVEAPTRLTGDRLAEQFQSMSFLQIDQVKGLKHCQPSYPQHRTAWNMWGALWWYGTACGERLSLEAGNGQQLTELADNGHGSPTSKLCISSFVDNSV
jgi:hypothetical protein